MYRIRTASGSESTFNSLEEFTAAVRRGDVHPEDEIFHMRANRWLDVKSHPHYRSAMTSHGEPASPKPAAPAPAPSATRAQVFERPVVKPQQQTVLRPQLQRAAPAPGGDAPSAKPETPARYGPPPKTKEIQFLDLGGGPADQRQKAAVIEAQKPPVQRTEARPAAKPEPSPGTPGTEVEFLVMDGGLESPVRTSAGQKTVPEDLHLLFDAPLPDPDAKRASQSDATVNDAPKQADADTAPDERSSANPSAASAALAASSRSARGAPPRVAAGPTSPAADEDLEIPSGPLLEAPVPAPELTRPPSRLPSIDSRTGIIAGSVALVAVVGTLLAWRPWRGAPAADGVAAQTAPAPAPATAAPAPAATDAPASPTPTPREPRNLGGASPAPARPADPPPAAEDTEGGDRVIAAVKPRFRPDAGLATANLSLGADVPSTTTVAVSPGELTRHYAAAGREAQQELSARLANAGYRGVLTGSRLSSAAGVAQARSAWAAGSDALRQYRARIARLEKAYEDSVLASQRSQRWSGEDLARWTARQSLSDPAEVAQLTDLMFNQVGEGLDLLAALSGEYTIKGDVITFKNPTSATRYVGIQNWVEQRISNWSSMPEGARPYTVSAILAALGGGFPTAK